jgi:hypothetical protein
VSGGGTAHGQAADGKRRLAAADRQQNRMATETLLTERLLLFIMICYCLFLFIQ